MIITNRPSHHLTVGVSTSFSASFPRLRADPAERCLSAGPPGTRVTHDLVDVAAKSTEVTLAVRLASRTTSQHRHSGVRTSRPSDSSPHGRFAPWAFSPALDISPHGRFAHRRFAPWMSGETSTDPSPRKHSPHTSMGRNVYGRIAHGAKCLVQGETSMRRNDHGAKSPWGEKSINRHSTADINQSDLFATQKYKYQRKKVK